MNISIGIDIGKRKCDMCVIDGNCNVLERGQQYPNTAEDAARFARDMARKYNGVWNTESSSPPPLLFLHYRTSYSSSPVSSSMTVSPAGGILLSNARA